MAAKQRHHLFGLAEPQQSVIDEYAGELLADRLVNEHSGDGGIDAARQAADHPALADLAADFLDRLVSLNARIVQSPVQPAILRTKLRRMAAPCGVCTTSRWNCVA